MFVYVCIKHVLCVLLMRVFFIYYETCKIEAGLSQSHRIASFIYGAVLVQTLALLHGRYCVVILLRSRRRGYTISRLCFEVERLGTPFPLLKKLPERRGTAIQLLKCLKTHYGRHC